MQKFPNLSLVKTIQREEGLQNLKYANILENSFVTVVLGTPGSGKSSVIEQLMLNPELYLKKFFKVLLISPSAFPRLTVDASTNELNQAWIVEQLWNIKEEISNSPYTHNVLIIMDDIVSQLKEYERSQYMLSLFLNRRNLIPKCTVSYIITTQKYDLIPLKFRTVATSIIVLDCAGACLKKLREEHLSLEKKEYDSMLRLRQGKHDFLYIKFSPLSFYLNFKPLMLARDLQMKAAQLNNQVITTQKDDETSAETIPSNNINTKFQQFKQNYNVGWQYALTKK